MVLERSVVVQVREGLHARPATQFVKLAKTFQSRLEIVRDGRGADAKSAVKLMLLGVKEADEVIIRADGDDAAAAVEQLAAFVGSPEAGIDAAVAHADGVRGPAAPASPTPAPTAGAASTSVPAAPGEAVLRGVAASEGAAIGPAFAFFPAPLVAPRRFLAATEGAAELARFRAALATMVDGLKAEPADAETGAIVDALVDVARDDAFAGDVEARIAGGVDAVTATLDAGTELAASFEALDDPYLAARAEDVRGVARSLALALLGRSDVSLARVPAGAVVVAEEISALDFARAPVAAIGGIVCTKGAATSHVAIMARTHGIPAVLGCAAPPAALAAATTIALDGTTGEVRLDPDAAAAGRFRARIAEEAAARQALEAYRTVEPRTRDGRLIEIAANLGALDEIAAAKAAGAMGVGLFRTELLFMAHGRPPSEDEQARVYATLAEAFAPHPVVVRTLDIGGDKPVAGVEFPHEDNPFLGWRGVRMCLERPEIFKPQLKALLRAAVVGNVKIMVPMVSDVGEIRRVKALLAECRAELDAAGVAYGEAPLGIMVETPAAALAADALAAESAFFSIGTNDLTQYVMAADRLNPKVADLNRADHPAVLKAVELACEAARKAGIWVGVCGEAAARPDLIPTFVRLGVTELSMSPSSILRAKATVVGL